MVFRIQKTLLVQLFLATIYAPRICQSDEPLTERPFYNIAHMVNSINEIDHYMSLGANAIEADVTFTESGNAKYTYHGSPCDCFRKCQSREHLVDYLEYVRRHSEFPNSKYHNRLALLMLDLKLDNLSTANKRNAGIDLVKKLIAHLWYEIPLNDTLNVLVSIPTVQDKAVFAGIRHILMKDEYSKYIDKLGYDVGLNSPLNEIKNMYQELKIEGNIWQGDGVSNCLSSFRADTRMKEALQIRDSEKAFMKKVYRWTIDLSTSLRTTIAIGADAVITNYPERVASLLIERRYKSFYRMATPSDSAWSRIQTPLFRPVENTPYSSPVVTFWMNFSEVASQAFKYISSMLGRR